MKPNFVMLTQSLAKVNWMSPRWKMWQVVLPH